MAEQDVLVVLFEQPISVLLPLYPHVQFALAIQLVRFFLSGHVADAGVDTQRKALLLKYPHEQPEVALQEVRLVLVVQGSVVIGALFWQRMVPPSYPHSQSEEALHADKVVFEEHPVPDVGGLFTQPVPVFQVQAGLNPHEVAEVIEAQPLVAGGGVVVLSTHLPFAHLHAVLNPQTVEANVEQLSAALVFDPVVP